MRFGIVLLPQHRWAQDRHRWVRAIDARPGAIRGRLVNTKAMPERHSAADFDAVEDRTLFEPVRKRADV